MFPARTPARFLVVVTIVAAAVGACSSGATAAWTYAPASAPSSAAPSGSSGASGSPGAGASSAPSASAGASAAASAGASGAGATLTVVAQNIQFDKTALDATAGSAVHIEFDNQDQGVPHNLDVKDASGATVAKTEITNGPTKQSLDLPALQAGSYRYMCDVHPNMTGTLTVR
jgi:plastocyanin